MSRHVRSEPLSDLLTGPISINAQVRTQDNTTRLVELIDDLHTWHDLNLYWGSINNLIDAINDTYAALGIDAVIPRGLE